MILFLKNLVFTIVVPGTVAVYVPVFFFAHDQLQYSLNTLAGGSLLIMGSSIYLWCLWDFVSAGRGTPSPVDPPKHLVVRGLYRYSRNPMYVGVLGAIFGWALAFGTLSIAIYGFFVAGFFHLFVVFYEEPHLRQLFGANYDEYRLQVSRWLQFHSAASPS